MTTIVTTDVTNGDVTDASVINGNFTAIKTAVNGNLDNDNIDAAAAIEISKLEGYPSDVSKVLKGDGTWATSATTQQGTEVAYEEKTTDTSITATSQGTANTVVTADAFVANGTSAYYIWLQAYNIGRGTNNLTVCLYLDGSVVQDVTRVTNVYPVTLAAGIRVTPAAGSRTYSVRAYVDAGTGTVHATGFAPAAIRITQVS